MKTCPICGKQFQTAPALRQHEADKHGARPKSGQKQQNAPRAQARRPRNRRQRMPYSGSTVTGVPRVKNGSVDIRPSDSYSNVVDEYSGVSGNHTMHLSSVLDKYDLADSEAGRAWVKKILNPCDETPLGPNGIPDMACDMVVPYHFRNVSSVARKTAGKSWDIALVTTPFPDRPVVWFRKETGANWEAGSVDMGYIGGSVPKDDWVASINKYRMMYQGLTVVLDAPATASEGMVYSYTTSPRIRKRVETEITGNSKEVIPPGDLSPLGAEGGDVVTDEDFQRLLEEVAQMAKDDFGYEGDIEEDGVGAYKPSTTFKDIWNKLWDEDQIMNFGGARMGAARNGLYLVNRPSTTSVNFRDNDEVTVNILGPDGKLSTPWVSAAPKDMDGDNDFTYGYVVFKGLDAKAKLAMKIVTGFEVIPAPESTLSSLQQPSPLYDRKALETVTKLMQTLPSSYPAEANDLGAILGPITQMLGSLGIPYISTAAKGVGMALPVAREIYNLFKNV